MNIKILIKRDWSYFDPKSTAIRKTFQGEPVSVGGSKIIGGLEGPGNWGGSGSLEGARSKKGVRGMGGPRDTKD